MQIERTLLSMQSNWEHFDWASWIEQSPLKAEIVTIPFVLMGACGHILYGCQEAKLTDRAGIFSLRLGGQVVAQLNCHQSDSERLQALLVLVAEAALVSSRTFTRSNDHWLRQRLQEILIQMLSTCQQVADVWLQCKSFLQINFPELTLSLSPAPKLKCHAILIEQKCMTFPIMDENNHLQIWQLQLASSLGFLNLAHPRYDFIRQVWTPIVQEQIYRIKHTTLFGANFENINHLNHYLSSSVLQRILSDDQSIQVPENRHVVLLYADIRNFTALSEQLTPSELVRLLNLYFEKMVMVVESFQGTVEKLVGDMLAVIWNAPKFISNPEQLALGAALEMQRLFAREVAPVWHQQLGRVVGMGIGLHCGPAVVGTMGSKSFHHYTVFGETADTALALEAMALAGEIWASSAIYTRTQQWMSRMVRKESVVIGKEKNYKVFVYK